MTAPAAVPNAPLAGRTAQIAFAMVVGALTAVVASTGVATAAFASFLSAEFAELCAGLGSWLDAHRQIFVAVVPAAMLIAVALGAVHSIAVQLRASRDLLARVGPPASVPPPVSRLAADSGVAGRVDFVASGIPLAFCHGVFRPRICVSRELVDIMSPDELAAVFVHEAHHLVRRDPARLLILRAAVRGLSFVPGAATLLAVYVAASEMAADRAASRAAGPVALASAMVKLAKCAPPNLGGAAVSPLSQLTNRIGAILEEPCPVPRVPARSVASLALGVALVVGSSGFSVGRALAPHSPPASPCVVHDIHGTAPAVPSN